MTREKHLHTKALKWLEQLKKTTLENQNSYSWVGIYWMESFVFPKIDSTDLILGPYIGFETPHTRISLQKGLCGRAIRENQTLNIDDVSQNSEYLSCSLETKSEIVIPLRGPDGVPLGELDIDAKILKAFNADLQLKLEQQCEQFSKEIFKEFSGI